jgi:hypothetical protein
VSYGGPPVGRRIGDTLVLDASSAGILRDSSSATIALRGIIGVGRVVGSLSLTAMYAVILEGGTRIELTSWESEYVRCEWESWERDRLAARSLA